MPQQSVPVLNIIGPVGIGKTSVAFAISDILQYDYDQIIPHAIIDLDDVRRVWPTPGDDPFNMTVGFKNLAAVWRNYALAGATCLIIPSVMESQEDFAQIRTAVPGANLFVVRLTSRLETNHARIKERQKTPESLAWHLDRATQLYRELDEKKLEDIIVGTDDREPREVAEEVVTHWGILEQLQQAA